MCYISKILGIPGNIFSQVSLNKPTNKINRMTSDKKTPCIIINVNDWFLSQCLLHITIICRVFKSLKMSPNSNNS